MPDDAWGSHKLSDARRAGKYEACNGAAPAAAARREDEPYGPSGAGAMNAPVDSDDTRHKPGKRQAPPK